MRCDETIEFIATGGRLGYYSKMPGTLGSAAAFVVAIFFHIHLWLILLTVAVGIFTSDYYCRKKGIDDPSEVVIDEIAGTWIAMYGLPAGYSLPALFLFRIVDIIKPVPICTVEKLPGGWGIMADDILGGLFVNMILLAVDWLFYKGGFAFIDTFI